MTRFGNWKTKVNKALEHGARVRQTRPHTSIGMARRSDALGAGIYARLS
jgi:hypothetical protein